MAFAGWNPSGPAEAGGGCPIVFGLLTPPTVAPIRSLPTGMKTLFFLHPSRNLGALAVCGALGFFAGCASEPESHVVSAPPPLPPSSAPAATVYSIPTPAAPAPAPAAVAVAPASPVGASSIVVVQSPPAAQQEVPSARPSSEHVWVAGYWTWSNNQYQWLAGHWEIPPRSGATWVPPRWQPEGTSWRFFEGYWD